MPDPAPLIVIGGGAGGHATVDAYRAHGGSGPVVLVSAEDRVPYFLPDLTKALVTGPGDRHRRDHAGLPIPG